MRTDWKLEHYHSKDPFMVPDGYFESLTARVMDKLPEHKMQVKQPRMREFRILFYAAAAFMGIIFCWGGIYSLSNMESRNDMALQDSIYMEEMMDYTMMSNLMIQQYLTDAYYGE